MIIYPFSLKKANKNVLLLTWQNKFLIVKHPTFFSINVLGPGNGTKTKANMVNFLSFKKKKSKNPKSSYSEKTFMCVAITTKLN